MFLEISNPTDYRVALYIRLSKEDENEGPSESVSNQLSLLQEFARERRLDVADTYIDDGWSGTSFDRPGFKRMIADIEAKKINMVLTKDLSRLGRDYILTGHYMERFFPEHRVRYISLLDGVDTGVDSTANDITPFRAIMNDMYAKDISKKVSSVKHDKQRKGLFIGGKAAYGYRLHPAQKNRIVVDEPAAAVVRRMFAMALDGKSCRQIAVTLNEEGVPSPSLYANLTPSRIGPYSGKCSSERVCAMLQNEVYIGNMVQGKSRKISYKTRKCLHQPQKDWIVVRGTHEPLIEEETFDRVQRLIASRKHTRSRTYDFPLKGLIVCHECGKPLAVINRPNAKGERVLYFMCRTYQRFTRSGVCSSHCIKEQKINEAIREQIRAICKRCMNTEKLLAIAQREIQMATERDRQRQEFLKLEKLREQLTAQLDRVYMDKLGGALDADDFARIYDRIKAERVRIDGRLSELKRADSSQEREQMAEKLVSRFLETAETNRELMVSLIERVELTAELKLVIFFRFRRLEEAS